MDELDLLKKDWKEKEKELPKLSYDEIYKMIWKKSSSYVKWIFIISIIELSLGIIGNLIASPSAFSEIKLPFIIELFSWISIPIILYFSYRFFKNYKNISTTSTIKGLLDDIIRARRTVKHYILFNLILGGVMSIIAIVYTSVEFSGGWSKFTSEAHFKEYAILIISAVLLTTLILGIIFGLYYLLYGILMKRLKRNYDELKKIES